MSNNEKGGNLGFLVMLNKILINRGVFMSDFEEERKFNITEDVPIVPFRAENLGLIRLKRLAFPDKERVRITVEDEEFIPRGFDVYGHPVISEDNYRYYCALKAIAERKGETVLAHVEYDDHPFFKRREIFDSIEGIQEAVHCDVLTLKKMLNYRKQFAFYRKVAEKNENQEVKRYVKDPLNEFIIFGHYKLSEDGHVYLCNVQSKKDLQEVEPISHFERVKTFTQFHFPGAEDFCSVCGKKFTIEDVANLRVTEKEDGRKVHTECFKKFKIALEHERASQIIDKAYCEQNCKSRVVSFLDQNGEEKNWYTFNTSHGTVALAFDNADGIDIRWTKDSKTPWLDVIAFFDEKIEDSLYVHHLSEKETIRRLQSLIKAPK